jgi:hypothetical protein
MKSVLRCGPCRRLPAGRRRPGPATIRPTRLGRGWSPPAGGLAARTAQGEAQGHPSSPTRPYAQAQGKELACPPRPRSAQTLPTSQTVTGAWRRRWPPSPGSSALLSSPALTETQPAHRPSSPPAAWLSITPSASAASPTAGSPRSTAPKASARPPWPCRCSPRRSARARQGVHRHRARPRLRLGSHGRRRPPAPAAVPPRERRAGPPGRQCPGRLRGGGGAGG